MIFLNHALTGALLGTVIDDPLVLGPAALGSHFALDAVPHFGYAKLELSHRRWIVTGIIDGAISAAAIIVVCLAWPQRVGHILFGIGMAVLPDLVYIPEILWGFTFDRWWRRLHDWIQWAEHPSGILIDAAWLALLIYLLLRQL